MICAQCNNPIPDNLLACPRCATARGRTALLDYQLEPLRKVAAGKGELITRAVSNVRHVQMFGDDHAFCGEEVSSHHRKNWIEWNEDELKTICAGCRKELLRLMEKACRASASL